MASKQTVGEKIREDRKALGDLSHDRLGEKIGTSRWTIIRWEKDQTEPSEKYRKRLAELTGRDPSEYESDPELEELTGRVDVIREARMAENAA